MYEEDLALNNLQSLICRKKQGSNQAIIFLEGVMIHRYNSREQQRMELITED